MKTKILLIFIVILTVFLALWGFFYSKNRKELLIYNKTNLNQGLKDGSDVVDGAGPTIEKESQDDDNSEKSDSVVAQETEKIAVSEEISKEEKVKNFPKIVDNLVNWGFSKAENRNIDTIILHSSYNVLGGNEYDFKKIILEYKEYGVAPHYVIDRDGNIFRLVEDSNIAYHAGESKVPDGRSGVNSFSLGIEMINSQKDSFTSSQYNSVNNLIKYLKDKYKIKYVLGHNQIAPDRKTDPWNIKWDKINK